MAVSRRLGIPWVADFRDPWTKIDYYRDLMLTRLADRRHHRLEHRVVSSADFVTVNSHDMKRYFNGLGVDTVQVIPNGYDPEDFQDPEISASPGKKTGQADFPGPDSKFSITHVGTITPSRNAETLWRVLSELVQENEDFARDLELKLIGDCDYSAIKTIEDLDLEKWVYRTRYVPHDEAIGILTRSQVLLLLIRNTPFARGAQPAKLFEYMSAGRPILCVGPPDGEAASFLDETKTGHSVDFNDHNGMKHRILDLYEGYRKGSLSVEAVNVEKYSRKAQTGLLADIFSQTLQNK
jgi:glycosyltransferase involved in cell wall biosynthesis